MKNIKNFLLESKDNLKLPSKINVTEDNFTEFIKPYFFDFFNRRKYNKEIDEKTLKIKIKKLEERKAYIEKCIKANDPSWSILNQFYKDGGKISHKIDGKVFYSGKIQAVIEYLSLSNWGKEKCQDNTKTKGDPQIILKCIELMQPLFDEYIKYLETIKE